MSSLSQLALFVCSLQPESVEGQRSSTAWRFQVENAKITNENPTRRRDVALEDSDEIKKNLYDYYKSFSSFMIITFIPVSNRVVLWYRRRQV